MEIDGLSPISTYANPNFRGASYDYDEEEREEYENGKFLQDKSNTIIPSMSNINNNFSCNNHLSLCS